ncbi:2-phospho-L-lactate guanylyltransferase [Nocardia sp. BMG111209]|uniref:2-phospho-L-lactate guanylyltransferase n=1 Tax=Nocardia sp. BMG111209 TaxID=1160137 RepID=UPI000365BF59|nr:2-phospho-L-lactate guanylyltransferase [Nocardia sp. BMG111209]
MNAESATGTGEFPPGTWVAVVPQRDITSAKSRLLLRPHTRQAVVRAMFRDTVAAIRAASQVRAVVVVVDRVQDAVEVSAPDVVDRFRDAAEVLAPDVVPLLVPDARGLNEAVRAGARRARELWPDSPLAVLPADLPFLRGVDLDRALSAAARHERAFVADRHRVGTTLLTAIGGADPDPRFGERSRRAHLNSGAVEIDCPGIESLRRDVDDLADLLDVATTRPGPALRATLRTLRRSRSGTPVLARQP